jgi:hypothetical protein
MGTNQVLFNCGDNNILYGVYPLFKQLILKGLKIFICPQHKILLMNFRLKNQVKSANKTLNKLIFSSRFVPLKYLF